MGEINQEISSWVYHNIRVLLAETALLGHTGLILYLILVNTAGIYLLEYSFLRIDRIVFIIMKFTSKPDPYLKMVRRPLNYPPAKIIT